MTLTPLGAAALSDALGLDIEGLPVEQAVRRTHDLAGEVC